MSDDRFISDDERARLTIRLTQLEDERDWIEREADPIDAGLLDVIDEIRAIRYRLDPLRHVTDATAVQVPHLHLIQHDSRSRRFDLENPFASKAVTCSKVECHSLAGRSCVFCGGAPCRVEFG